MTRPENKDWWTLAEELTDLAAGVAGLELPSAAREHLVEIIVELVVLLTCWPNQPRPTAPLTYLRTRRNRMGHHAPWLYALPHTTRMLLTGTDRRPSLLEFSLNGSTDHAGALGRGWREGLVAFIRQLEVATPSPDGSSG